MDDGDPSLCPPRHGFYSNDAEAPRISWALLDLNAYIADRKNSTTACADMSDTTQIQVTFCAAPPPLVSYICVWCPSGKPEDTIEKIVLEPTVEAAESDLLLLKVKIYGRLYGEYFVYKANDGRGRPSLQRLELLGPCLDKRCSIALLARRDVICRHPYREGDSGMLPCPPEGLGVKFRYRPHGEEGGHGAGTFHLHPRGEHDEVRLQVGRHGEDDSYYYVAVLNFDSNIKFEYTYKLWVFDSKVKQWSSRLLSVHCPLYHLTCKVISLGGNGLLGFVDPWRGIIVCDMLGHTSPQYLQLPPKLIRNDKLTDTGLLYRDIALVEGRLTLVDLCPATEPDIKLNWNWEISTWSRKVIDLWEEDWHDGCNVQDPDIIVDKETDLLPVLKDCQGTPRPTLGKLHIAHPILSLCDSHVVYIMAKVQRGDNKALVLSIDLKKPRLQGVAVFDAERMYGYPFSYTCTQSWIPKYFNPGVKENPKRPGNFHLQYPRKLQGRMDDILLPTGVEKEYDKEAEHEDSAMDLD